MDHFADEAPALKEAEGEEETDDDAPDRANRVGFYQEEEDIRGNGQYRSPIFCMRKKDVRTVHRRFACFYTNWKDFQLKDLVVKRIAIGDTEATFHPTINELSQAMLP
jgi:hypothetical protein